MLQILIGMRHMKQKPVPFFVKRVRLRKSIIKTNQILETISNYDIQSSKYLNINSGMLSHEQELKDKKNTMPLNRSTIDQFQLYSTKTNRLNVKNMNNIIKICNDYKKKAIVVEMNKAGIQARRIIVDMEQTRKYQSSSDRTKRKKEKEQSCSRMTNIFTSIDTLDFDIRDLAPSCSSIKKESPTKKSQRSLVKCSTALTPNRRNRVYLYQKMAQMGNATKNQQNHIYEKRIKSYVEFLWKCMLGHNIYIDLDLQHPSVSNKKYKPCKAYIGFGNNSNMIKSLIKRRFWWVISEEMTDDCAFVWTQIKINKIYEKQERAPINKVTYSDQNIVAQYLEDTRFCHSSNLKQRIRETNLISKRKENQLFNKMYTPHHKIWNEQDYTFLKALFKNDNIGINFQGKQGGKEISYYLRTETIKKKCKNITKIDNFSNMDFQNQSNHNYYRAKPLIHNHLQNNFFLGNKKALFYSLKQYYQKIGQNVFQFLPLTFHIKSGFKDPQYKKFLAYYDSRAKTIKKQSKNEKQKQKFRNIWIVKPGQNSNQGRGITVIDEIYEFDRIIKQSLPKSKPGIIQQDPKTFIVQLYIDRPLLYNDRKFDIRHYMLITNLYGVTRAYWYEQGYIRTSAYRFNIDTFQPQIHLTNDAIQKNYQQYGRYQPANKISYFQFQSYLNTLGEKRFNFKEDVLPKMKQMGKDAAKSVYTKMSPQNQMHNFEIYGLDFMIDRNFKPWLIQINTNPCLECVCPLLERIIPYMVQQAFKLSIDLVYPPPTHYPNTSKHYAPLINLQNFKYELIFDSLNQGEALQKLFSQQSSNLVNEIGVIQQDQQFKDDGKQIKLQDFT